MIKVAVLLLHFLTNSLQSAIFSADFFLRLSEMKMRFLIAIMKNELYPAQFASMCISVDACMTYYIYISNMDVLEGT